MKGQWIGKYEGDTEGNIMINIDEVDDHFEGVAYIIPSDKNMVSSVAYIKTKNTNKSQFNLDAYINPVNPGNFNQALWEDIKHLYPEGTAHSSEAKVNLEIKNNTLSLDALSDIGIKLKSKLVKPINDNKSKIRGTKMSWADFKEKISCISKTKYLFRGQKEPWRLCTSFHRRERYRVNEFTKTDVPLLHQKLSAITKHYFELDNPNQNGSFLNLLQHHGYPTPLLDWSHSPYVAAFFAFRDWSKKYDGDDKARIYIFNNDKWSKDHMQISYLDPPFPHLSVMEFIAINNPRLVPQQAVTTVTNLYDIEAYILEREAKTSTTYLEAIDIPAKEREHAMRDLRFMGITAGSMFPSIDGVCEELKELNFNS